MRGKSFSGQGMDDLQALGKQPAQGGRIFHVVGMTGGRAVHRGGEQIGVGLTVGMGDLLKVYHMGCLNVGGEP